MKIALRNFLTTLRRYKASSLLNIIGLTLAFTACYIILVQVRWEMTYNRTLRDSERIYLVESTDWYTPGLWQAWLCRPMSERLIASTSAVEAGGCSWSGFGPTVVLRENASKMGYDRFNTYSGFISLSLLDVFDFQPVAGDVHDLKRAQSVIISRTTAEQLGVGVGTWSGATSNSLRPRMPARWWPSSRISLRTRCWPAARWPWIWATGRSTTPRSGVTTTLSGFIREPILGQ